MFFKIMIVSINQETDRLMNEPIDMRQGISQLSP